jgi:TetR/AcrR family transcriptional regulator
MTEQDIETRDRILIAAHTVFLQHGTHGARMQEIADEAGVNKALLHYYFGSKALLADAVFERASGELFPRLFGILQSELTIEEKVRSLVPTYIDFLSTRPYLPGFVINEMHAHPERLKKLFRARGPAPLDTLARQIALAVDAGQMRPIAPEQFVINLIAMLVFPFVARPALETLLRVDPKKWDAFLAERRATLADFFLSAIRP